MRTITGADGTLVLWLRRLVAERDLRAVAPDGDPRAHALRVLVAAVSGEFAQYRAIVENVSAAVARNDEQLATVAAATVQHVDLVRETRAAAAEATAGAAGVTEAAEALERLADTTGVHGEAASAGLAGMRAALDDLGARLRDGAIPLRTVVESTAGIDGFLASLTRLAKQAQLLGINAAIEAAHLADEGRRFAIVANEVRALSTSTHDSARRVAGIVGDMREAGARVEGAIRTSDTATQTARDDVAAASLTLTEAHGAIAGIEMTIAELSKTAGAQTAALRNVVDSMDAIAAHADEASASARIAAELGIDAVRKRVVADVTSWRAVAAYDLPTMSEDPFSRWVAGLADGTSRLDDAPSFDSEDALLGEAVREFVETVNAAQREVHLAIAHLATGVARNGFAWGEIGLSLSRLGAQLDAVRTALRESAAAAHDAARLAAQIRELAEAMQRRYDEALGTVDRALVRIEGAAQSVQEIGRFVESAVDASTRADEVLDVIEHISSETNLLALNAAIEAAHAGDAGRGFSVIASEIRSLALSTTESAQNVARLLAEVRSGGRSLHDTFDAAASQTSTVDAAAQEVRAAIGALRTDLGDAVERGLSVTATAEEQSRSLERILASADRSARAVDESGTAARDERRAALMDLVPSTYVVAGRRPIGLAAEQIRPFVARVAERVEAAIDAAVARGAVRTDQLFDFRYEELRGERVRALARLFDVSRVPAEGFDPPKFAAPYDAAIDISIADILDEEMKRAGSFRPLTIILSDINSFLWGYPRHFMADWTGDPRVDNQTNRIKRFNEERFTMQNARCALERGDIVPHRAMYSAFVEAGCVMERPADERPWRVRVYARDTSVVYNELAMPVYVGSRRHSTVRFIYDADVI
jgi:methyl-accepting chemotaxis protein